MAGPFDNIPIAEDPEFLRQMDPYYQPDLTPEAEAEPTEEELSTEVFSEAFERAMKAEDPSEEILMDERFMGSGPDPLADMQFEPDYVGSGPDPSQPLDSFQQAMIANAPANLDVTPAEFGGNLGQPQPVDTIEADTALDNSFDRELDVTLDPYEELPVDLGEIPLSDLNADGFAERRIDEELAAKEERRLAVDAETLELTARQNENETYKRTNDEAHLAQTQAILKESVELGQVKVDPDRWYSSAGTGRKIGTWMAVLAGGQLGILSGRGGNEGLDFVLGEIGKDIDAQKSNIMNKRAGLNQQQGLVAQVYQLTGDMFRAEQTAILTAFESMDARITAEMAGQDPEGTQAMEKEILLRNLRAKKAQHIAGLEEQSRNRSMEDTEFDMKRRDQHVGQLETEAKIRKLNADAAKARRRGTGRRKPKGPSTSELLRAKLAHMAWDPQRGWVPDGTGSAANSAETKESAERRGAVADADRKEKIVSGSEVARTVGTRMLTKSGNEILAGDPTEAKKARKQKSQLVTLTGLIDDMTIMREKDGFSSATLKSKEWQTMKSNFSQFQVESGSLYELGVLSSDDLKIINGILATSDPTEIRDMTAGFAAGRKGMVKRFNDHVATTAPLDDPAEWYEPPRKRVVDAIEKPLSETVQSTAGGLIPEHMIGDTEGTKKVLSGWRETIDYATNHKSPSQSDIREMAKNINGAVRSGEITEDQAIGISSGMAKKFADLEHRRIVGEIGDKVQNLSPSDIRELEKDPPQWMIEAKEVPVFKKDTDFANRKLYRYMLGAEENKATSVEAAGRVKPSKQAPWDAETLKLFKDLTKK